MSGSPIPGGVMHPLRPFPDAPHPAIDLIVEIFRPTPATLRFWFTFRGNLSGIQIPDVGEPIRSDGLWQHTCCEVFLRAEGDEGYREFNFSPSRRWAAYRLAGYRDGMENLDLTMPEVNIASTGNLWSIGAAVTLNDSAADKNWHLGLSAVIEEKDGTKSYWALKHPPGAPDFHHPDCFALTLPPPDKA